MTGVKIGTIRQLEAEGDTPLIFHPNEVSEVNVLLDFMMTIERSSPDKDDEMEEEEVSQQPNIPSPQIPFPGNMQLFSHSHESPQGFKVAKQLKRQYETYRNSEIRIRKTINGFVVDNPVPRMVPPDISFILKLEMTREYSCANPDALMSVICRWAHGKTLQKINSDINKPV